MITSLIAGVVTFLITFSILPVFIEFYHTKRLSGQQMHADVKQHQNKGGTPTLGGIVFLSSSICVTLFISLLFNLFSNSLMMLISVILIYAFIGFLDDCLKIFNHRNEGWKPKQKLVLQIIGGIIFYLFYDGGNLLNFFGFTVPLGIFYIFFVLIWLVGFSNAVNLTDGIDGLASISVAISLFFYSIIALQQQRFDILLMIYSMIGSLFGFFIFNRIPAKIFMGDVGSLSLGGMLSTISIILNQDWTLLLIGIVYVLETTSVIIQIIYFKLTKGKRIFRMAPLHHHFELGGFSGDGKGWNEWQVDFFLWSVGILGGILTLVILYF